MDAYLSGDSDAFNLIYQRHSGRVYAFLRKRVERREQVDEIFQRVFTKFHLSRHQYDPAYALSQWLFVIAKTALLDHWKVERRRLDQPLENEAKLDEIPPEIQDDTALVRQRLEGVFEAFPSDVKVAVGLRVFDELSYEEIAKRIGKSPANVRQIVSRAIKRAKASVSSASESSGG